MSMLLSRLSRLRLGKPVSVRSSLLLLISSGFSSSSLQTPPCFIIGANPCGPSYPESGKLIIFKCNECDNTHLEKKVPLELVDEKEMVTIGSSHGWVATLKDDGIVRLQDDLNPTASDTYPRRIPLPPLVTLPHCQTQIVTNMAMSSPFPEFPDCIVAIKFLGPQLSFCRPVQSNSEWTNIRIEDPCFFSSRVMFSRKDDMFRIPGSGGHLIGSWDLRKNKHNPKIQRLRFQNLPELTKTKRELLDSCCTSEHLVESRTTGETFLLKWYRKATANDMTAKKTKAVMVFKLDEEGNAVYTKDIGDLCIFLSKSEPFCVSTNSFPGMCPSQVEILDVDEEALVDLETSSIISTTFICVTPYYIPPQKIDFNATQNGFSSSSLQTPPCFIIRAVPCGADLGNLIFNKANGEGGTHLEKKVPLELMKEMGTVGSSHGWVATLKEDGVLRLQDDLNPAASDTDPKRIPLPPLVTLPHCQTQIVTNVAMPSSSPEDDDCVVAVKFLGPQLSFCRPAKGDSEWTNIRIENPCFFSSRVMFSKKHDMFRIPGSGGHLIGSWGLHKHKHNPKIQRLRFKKLPELTKAKRELLHSCCTSEHLVESRATSETFLVKWYRKATASGMVKMKTRALMVFNIDEEGNAVYTKDIGDLCIFISQSEPFCVPVSSISGMCSNIVQVLDADESAIVSLEDSSFISHNISFRVPYHIPPQNVD